MTDRQKWLKEHFLEPEVRDGVAVSAELKKIWKVEMDMLEAFIAICNKHNLSWFMIGGSLIGTVRHKGFVPWDDDIDVAMPRPDYERFLRVAPAELAYPLQLSSSALEPERWQDTITKICNSQTAATRESYLLQKRHYNFGIFLDIIPLDGVRNSGRLSRWRRFVFFYTRRISQSYFQEYSGPRSMRSIVMHCLRKGVYALFGNRILEWVKRKMVTNVPYGSTELCGAIGIDFLDRDVWHYAHFKESITLPFEYLDVKCPAGFEQLLTERYGDWRTMKPHEVYHSFDYSPDRPFREVVMEMAGYDPVRGVGTK